MLDTHLYLLFIYLEDGWETEGSRGLLHFNKQNCDGPPRNSKNCRGNRCYNYNFMRFSISPAITSPAWMLSKYQIPSLLLILQLQLLVRGWLRYNGACWRILLRPMGTRC